MLISYVDLVAQQYPAQELNFVIMGIAYGGEVEAIAKYLKINNLPGKVYGFDTFEDLHPKHLAKDKNNFEATCMDGWYASPEFGTQPLAYEYQRKVLDDQGLDNAILIKGEVAADSCKKIGPIHYAFLDMDMISSMRTGFEAVSDKIISGGYVMLHDVLPKGHLDYLYNWCWDEVMKDKRFVLDYAKRTAFSVVFKKK